MLLSGLAWFGFVAITMSGSPWREALQPSVLGTVWNQTQFGTIWQLRVAVWLAAAAVATCSALNPSKMSLQKNLAWIDLFLGALLLGSLAWGGHGREDSRWHLSADVVHLLVAGFWPTGLLPLVLLLRRLRAVADSERWSFTAALVRRFSALSLVSVVALVLTGWVNAWYLVGSVANLFEAPYGRWLLVKLALFGCAVAIGAVNLLRLKPRFLGEKPSAAIIEATSAHLRCNVELELVLGTAIVIVVAVLGGLPPAVH
jgi:putative copper resistance protein D